VLYKMIRKTLTYNKQKKLNIEIVVITINF
jgi:hypothetical protein